MIPPDQEKIRQLYETRLGQFGDAAKTVGWGSRADQFLRFAMLARGLNLRGKRILDIGCGLGDFVTFAEDQTGGDFVYLGIDIAEKLVAFAREKYGGPRRTFVCGDFLDTVLDGTFDLVFLSGALSVRVSDNMTLARETLAKMANISGEAAAANFLSTHVDYQLDKDFHFDPGEMLNYAMTLKPWARVFHDYPLYEFTIQILSSPSTADRSP